MQYYSTKNQYGYRREEPAEKDYNIWKTAMSRMAPDKFLSYTLGKWLQKSHNTEMWTFDEKIER